MQEQLEKLKDAAKQHQLYQNIVRTDGKIVLGKGRKESPEILFLGEAPAFQENLQGIPFVGKSGKLLDCWIAQNNLQEKYAVINAVPIIPLDSAGNIRKPTSEEITYFRPYVIDLIKKINPQYVICLGKTAAECLGMAFENKKFEHKTGFIYHPSYYLRNNVDGQADFYELIKKIFAQKAETVLQLKQMFSINQQIAENLGQKEMISGILAGLHDFARQAKIFFKDINQRDECYLGENIVKIYTRDAFADEDMMIRHGYYEKHPEVQLYILCKIKAGHYSYIGYVPKETVGNARIVQSIGKESAAESGEYRRIFSDQYLPISDLLKIFEKEEKEELVIINQNYVPLHMHSEFSIGDGFGRIQYIAEALYKKGFKAAALTDHGTVAGIYEFQKAMLERNIKPIIGTELYVTIPELENKRFHLIALAKDEQGWQNLLKLQSLAVKQHFYYKPLVPIDELYRHHKGLIITTACDSSPVHHLIAIGQIEIAESYIEKLQEVFDDDFYGEVQAHEAINNCEIMQKAVALYLKYKIKMIFTTDAHYPYKEDKKFHEAIKAIALKKQYGEAGFGDDCFYLMQDSEIAERLERLHWHWLRQHIDQMKKNTFEIAEKCNFIIKPIDTLDTLPKLYHSKEERAMILKQLCINGLENTVYKYEGTIKDRLDLEINRILNKGYENYFLIVCTLINWAKAHDIMTGAGRGSVSASLVAYCLGITKCDPIKFNLLFDRFLSEIRRDMPDIDMDFQDNKRDLIFKYLSDTYGKNNNAKIATYSRFHAKGMIRDIGRIFSIPISEIEKINALAIQRTGGDARNSFTLLDTFAEFEEAIKFKQQYPEAVEIAIKLESHVRNKGIHASAVVLSEFELSHYVPICRVNDEIAIEWEKQSVEDMKLIKFDVLGLKTLTVLAECVKDTGQPLPNTFDDQKVYDEIFKTGNTLGVFQIETIGMMRLVKKLQVDNFKTLYDATTLFRPAALHSGQTMLYVKRHLGEEQVKYEHPLLEKITKDTNGIILYQEQVMQVMNQIGGMSWAAAETVRKIITKSKGAKAFEVMREEFTKNASRINSMPEEEARRLFDVVSLFGSYGFNLAHAIAYSMISYQCAWYKTYYPLQFFKAILKYETDKTQVNNYLQDAKNYRIIIEYPHINKSQINYNVIDGEIYSGLNAINGIGDKGAKKIIANQPYVSFEDFLKRCKVGENVLKGLIVADCFREFKINKKLCFESDIKELKNYYNTILPDFDELSLAQKMFELTVLKPNIEITNAFNFGVFDFIDIGSITQEQGGQSVFLRGIVTEVINKDKLLRKELLEHAHKFEQHIIYLNLNDGSGNIAVQINPWTYERYKAVIGNISKKPVIVFGILAKDAQKLYGDMIEIAEQNGDITKYKENLLSIKQGEQIIISATAAVSKNKKSYYRVRLHDGTEGLCFRFQEKLFPNMIVQAKVTQKPFIDIVIIKKGEKYEEQRSK